MLPMEPEGRSLIGFPSDLTERGSDAEALSKCHRQLLGRGAVKGLAARTSSPR